MIEFSRINFILEGNEVRFYKFYDIATQRIVEIKNNIMNYLDLCKTEDPHESKNGLIIVADDQFVVR